MTPKLRTLLCRLDQKSYDGHGDTLSDEEILSVLTYIAELNTVISNAGRIINRFMGTNCSPGPSPEEDAEEWYREWGEVSTVQKPLEVRK